MNKHNAKNDRIKYEYFRYQAEAKQKTEATVAAIRKAIDRFETYNGHKCFSTFNKEQAVGFKKNFGKQKAERTGQPISKATLFSTTNALKEFFAWLSSQPGYKSKIDRTDIEYLNLLEKDVAIAKAVKYRNFPTLEQIRKVILSMPTVTVIERRNQALVAFTLLTCMRVSAVASIKIRHIDETHNPILVRQEPDVVKTKFSKQIMTFFFPVGDDLTKIFIDWLHELRTEYLFGINDPLFPRTKVIHDGSQFKAENIEPEHWRTGSSIRGIFKEAFHAVGLPYFNPHSLRHTLGHIAQSHCKSPEQFKAWSQNLGHASPLTTLMSYGEIDTYRQGEIMKMIKS